ncbi:MAG: DUF2306 domain-containing protein [Gemmatimonadetes bacterium]|nr:DUF2306 domain-containing protein [Gemmatimonadota bacterium]
MKQSRKDWLVPAALIALSLVPAAAGTARVVELTNSAHLSSANARFFAAPIPIVLHIVSVVIYSMLGAFQFSPGLRKRYHAWHRTSGRMLVPFGLLGAITGLWMAQHYPWPAGDGWIVYAERLVAGSAMVLSIGLGIHAIRRRDFKAHGAWMTRAYAIGLGAGTQVLTHLPWFLLVDTHPGELPRGVMMGAGWSINILFAEWVIRRGARTPRPAVSFPTHAVV